MRIIYHHPLPLNKNAQSASGIRPVRMLEAFEALGCKVDLVTGYSGERKRCIKHIKNNIKKGIKYDFVYSESSTMPTMLTDRHHLPLNPFIDSNFFSFCNNNSIPIGLFYRDIYWRFENYGVELNPFKKYLAKVAYLFDLWVYRKSLAKLYLPSIKMGEYVPLVKSTVLDALPPGHSVNETKQDVFSNDQRGLLKLFYVGGMSEHYRLHKLVAVVNRLPKVSLTICTRETEWLSVRSSYPNLKENIRVIHESGETMQSYLNESDIAILFVEPQEYREFAAPVKLYEYLGFSKPILATRDTLAGDFVSENEIGWTLPYEEEVLRTFLEETLSDRSLLNSFRSRLGNLKSQHNWLARAEKVIKDLS